MTAKEWLSRGWEIDGAIKELHEAKGAAFARATSITACGASGVCVQESRGNSSERKMLAYAEYDDAIDELTANLFCVQGEIVRAISKLKNPVHQRILTARYVNFKEWKWIMRDIHYERAQMFREHSQALREIEEIVRPNDTWIGGIMILSKAPKG